MQWWIVAIVFLAALVSGPTAADDTATSTSNLSQEEEILLWSREKQAHLAKTDKAGPAAEWQKHMDAKDYEWLALNLAVHYTIEKKVSTSLKGKRKHTPKLDQTLDQLKHRLRKIGFFIAHINGG